MQRTETKGNLGTTICAVFLVKFREDNAENNTRNIFFFYFFFSLTCNILTALFS